MYIYVWTVTIEGTTTVQGTYTTPELAKAAVALWNEENDGPAEGTWVETIPGCWAFLVGDDEDEHAINETSLDA